MGLVCALVLGLMGCPEAPPEPLSLGGTIDIDAMRSAVSSFDALRSGASEFCQPSNL